MQTTPKTPKKANADGLTDGLTNVLMGFSRLAPDKKS